jgi:hypothetical protein
LAILLIILIAWLFVLLLTIALCRAARAGDHQRTIPSPRRLSPRRFIRRARPRARRSAMEHAQPAAARIVAPERRSSHEHSHRSPDRLA